MGVDAKIIGLYIWKGFGITMNASLKCVQKYPVVSGVLLFSFFMYIFMHNVFWVLIYSSPILIGSVVYFRYNRKQPSGLKIEEAVSHVKKEDETSSVESKSPESDRVITRTGRSYLKPQRSVRRNARRRVERMSQDWDARVTLQSLCKDLFYRKTVLDDSPKASGKEEESFSFDPGEISSHQNVDESKFGDGEQQYTGFDSEFSKPDPVDESTDHYDKFTSGGGETENSSVDDDEEEETQERAKGALEWTSDDQKNLMDLGDSELERNRRLESLIARRRARKLLKLAVEKSLNHMENVLPDQIAPIITARNNHFDLQNISDNIPGSAPSVMLPARNPFDIPYDPLEEKPNLMGDTFYQEFSSGQHKDTMYCRHESFRRAPHASDLKHIRMDAKSDSCSNMEKRLTDRPGYPAFKRPIGMEDHGHGDNPEKGNPMSYSDFVDQRDQDLSNEYNQVEDESGACTESGDGEMIPNAYDEEPRFSNASDVQMERDTDPDPVRNNDSESSSSFSPRECENSISDLNRAVVSENLGRTVGKHPPLLEDTVGYPFNCPIGFENSAYSNPIINDKRNFDDHMFYKTKGSCHTPTFSIASDMQVEVSEVGSPPATVDGNISSADGELYTFDGDLEKEMISGSEGTWGSSPYLPPIDETEPKVKEIYNGSVEDDTPLDPSASSTLQTQIASQDMDDTTTMMSSGTEIPYQDKDDDTTENVTESVRDEPAPSGPSEENSDTDIVNLTNPAQDIQNDENINESLVSGVNQGSDSSLSSTLPNVASFEQVSPRSSSFSSPRSVLAADNVLPGQMPTTNSEVWPNLDIPQSYVENAARDTSPGASQNGQNSIGDSVAQSPNNSIFEIMEEQEDSLGISMDDSNISNKKSENKHEEVLEPVGENEGIEETSNLVEVSPRFDGDTEGRSQQFLSQGEVNTVLSTMKEELSSTATEGKKELTEEKEVSSISTEEEKELKEPSEHEETVSHPTPLNSSGTEEKKEFIEPSEHEETVSHPTPLNSTGTEEKKEFNEPSEHEEIVSHHLTALNSTGAEEKKEFNEPSEHEETISHHLTPLNSTGAEEKKEFNEPSEHEETVSHHPTPLNTTSSEEKKEFNEPSEHDETVSHHPTPLNSTGAEENKQFNEPSGHEEIVSHHPTSTEEKKEFSEPSEHEETVSHNPTPLNSTSTEEKKVFSEPSEHEETVSHNPTPLNSTSTEEKKEFSEPSEHEETVSHHPMPLNSTDTEATRDVTGESEI